ncbi:MAG TPA: ferredoxin [Acidimicrobiales bacterium]|nr:ferredoxin [Acidimicrobiales bacterium]
MRIKLDPDACQGHGRCYALAPDVFDSDDFGHCVLLVDEVPEGREKDAADAVDNCPEQALSLED